MMIIGVDGETLLTTGCIQNRGGVDDGWIEPSPLGEHKTGTLQQPTPNKSSPAPLG